MPSGDTAEGKAAQRARATTRTSGIEDNGGPRYPGKSSVGLDWYAKNLEPLAYESIESIAEEVGFMECLVSSGSTTANGGMTVQLQVLPAYMMDALDMVQRSTQGVLLMRIYQVPWEAFCQDTPAWAHLSHDGDDLDADGI